jgi:hypothetical protein
MTKAAISFFVILQNKFRVEDLSGALLNPPLVKCREVDVYSVPAKSIN